MAPRRLPKLSLMRIFAVVVIVPTAMVFTVLVTMIKSSHEYKVTEEVQLEVSHDGRALGVLTLGLFGEAVPLTVNNFVTLATSGYKGYSYKGSIFHRVIKKFMVQGGDVISGNGQGSVSIYGPSFMDERLDIKHAAPGFLSMANRGKDTNGCQFFVTTIATPWLDGHHVVFGKLVEGMSVLYHMESVATDYNNRPLQDLIITSSSRRLVKTPYYITDQPYK
ncbi:hypothetical protein OTU49_007743 [Cherax quadricarinatus]|uniref:Peptidyl-prolyl cis-trans isomerase n=1 Tax=Cherax quadricarinatus TaxID=27406 RepID=A0AAW0WUP5_CHEQU